MEVSLFKHTVAPGQGVGFLATSEAGFALLEPLKPLAEAWLRANVSNEATWNGDSVVIEMRYFPALADAIIAAGFSFERNALPN